MNVVDIEENVQELVFKGFKPDTFIFDFVEAYDAPKALIQQLKGGHQNLTDVSGAVLWRRNLHYKFAPKGQVALVIADLERSQATSKYKTRFVISTDGDEFSAHDLVNGSTINCHFDELAVHFASFLPLAGIFIDDVIEENPIDIKATKRLTKFYDSILQDNPTWKADEMRPTLNHFITQVIFCLFAEDTGIIADNSFTDTIRTYCENDSKQAQPVITEIFTAMAHPKGSEERSCLHGYAQTFPYVNGGLFRGAPQVPSFLRGSVRYLLDAGALDWKEINPDIFGSMIQAIVHQDQRGELGMHYTSVSNILKLLKPLFLNDLQKQVQTYWNSKNGLQNVLKRLMKIRVFDPACGSGNFLVIAYRELRNIEIQIIRRLGEISDFSAGAWSHVDLKNFFGIEYIDFAAETAKLSLWISEYQMNKRYEDEFGKLSPSLPLKATDNIHHGNALRIAWECICPISDDLELETYIVGNPPYLGYNKQNSDQKEDLRKVFERTSVKYKSLDYISGWFYLAANNPYKNCMSAFVTTNSICQGEQSTILWPAIFETNSRITFAYEDFYWKNNATQNAAVIVTIIGLSKESKEIFFYYKNNFQQRVQNINEYLAIAPNAGLKAQSKPINILPKMTLGNMPKDGGNLILSAFEAKSIIEEDARSKKFIKKYIGSSEFIKGSERFCIWVNDDQAEEAYGIPEFSRRFDAVAAMRSDSDAESTREWAKYPWRFKQVQGASHDDSIIVPRVSSINRKFLPVGFLSAGTIISDSAYAIFSAEKWMISLLTSKMHRAWVDRTSGKLKNDYRYSSTMSWHTFPVPELNSTEKNTLKQCAEGILLARDNYFEHTIAELYDPKNMQKKFPELWEAHLQNDAVLEAIYNGKSFENDTERLEHLFARYVDMTSKPARKQSEVIK